MFRVYLPTVGEPELRTIAGSVLAYFMENADASALLAMRPQKDGFSFESFPLVEAQAASGP